MVRPYAVKWRKKQDKKRKLEEKEEEEEEEEEELEDNEQKEVEEEEEEEKDEDKEVAEAAADEIAGLPVVARPIDGSKKKKGVIFVLEKACLEVGKVGKTFQILNSDDHSNYLRKQNRNPADYRPDIIHQALLAIFDSPVTKAGRLQAVYVRTEKGVLFEIKPHVRMPRTFKRFCGLMSQLLQKLSITAVGKREKLLNVIKNPVSRHLPVDSRRIGLSYSSEKSINLVDYVANSSEDSTLVFVVGAMAHGVIDKENLDDFVSICNYPLSAACCLNRICGALEQKWNIR
ncbi:Ribosomal RNA small subunit methyltransferase NEP1 [Rhynchospora pubera]|uniref:Ribosomal RNA small subunit methyltransferase NEP1 n=1 Tax=Rhynchospora pubera TaxID=906938 RepID=A0AAV8FAB6_9POAL|nr:Ribosomal RNA small subunit methyltransferase NEP1 [Rhynchospora pubera]KAJ4788574.1 Ribosomal RNA small subunit methyltransferase NEP1 [Rhynchospora pubera]